MHTAAGSGRDDRRWSVEWYAPTVAVSDRLMDSRLVSVDASEWTALRTATSHDVYDSPGYVRVAAWQEGGEPAGIFVRHEDGRQLLIPLVIRDIDGRRRDASSPYGYPGILTNRPGDAKFVREAMKAAISTLRDEGIVSLFVRLHPLLPVTGVKEVGEVRYQKTVAVDLSLPSEQIWAETRQNHRRDIRKALKNGLVFSFENSAEAHDEFQRIYRATMERLDAAAYYRFGREYFERLSDSLGDHLLLAIVRMDGHAAAAGLFTQCRGIVQLHLAGSDQRYAVYRPTKVLYSGICTWAKERGDHWFHIGGGLGSDEDSLFHFKAGFSTYRAQFGTLRVVVREDDYRELVATSDPDADASDLSGYFPAYRRLTSELPGT